MFFTGQNDPSLGPKLFFIGVFSAAVSVAGLMMFVDLSSVSSGLESYAIKGVFIRSVVLFSCLVIYLLRLIVTTFVFVRRRLPWGETLIIAVLMSSAAIGFARAGGNEAAPLGTIEYAGILFYLIGSYLNTRSEQTRHVWKLKPENKGRLYTEGLFRYSMHINYFGDIVLFSGLAMVCHSIWIGAVPLLMALNFVFVIIPRLDAYLADKYADEFPSYAKRTKKLVPFVY